MGIALTWLGIVVGIGVLAWQAKRRGLATDGMALLGLAGIVCGLIGAKLSELVFHGWPVRISFWTLFDPATGGRALLGGVIFGWIAVEVGKRKIGLRRSTGDLFALALPAGEAVGRVGCFFNGCCYGTESSSTLAVYQHGAWRHPAQIYSAVVAASIFGILLVMDRSSRMREGSLFRWYLLLFGTSRFGLEFVRENHTSWLGLTPMQWSCLELAVFAGVSLAWWGRRTVRQA